MPTTIPKRTPIAKCECAVAGHCQRHKREKTQRELELCKSNAHWRALWDVQAESGDRKVCTRWETVPEGGFRCQDCNRPYHDDGSHKPPEGRPCVAAFTPIASQASRPEQAVYCTEWEITGTSTYRCRRCGQMAAAHSPDALPRDRACVVQAQPQAAPQPAKKCGGCGDRAPSLPITQPAGKQASKPAKPEPELPPMTERVLNLLGAARDFIRKPGFVSHEEAAADLATCDTCDFVSGHFCSVCGCWLKTAVTIESKNCPMGKWARDKKSWVPSVHDNWLRQTLVVIPHYLNLEMTHACVNDCFREPVRVLVVDNSGSYRKLGNEEVVNHGSNIGWAGACQLGIDRMMSDDSEPKKRIQSVVLLNNDVRLSPQFFSGLIVAQRVTGAGIVSASYNIGWPGQRTRDNYNGEASKYQPKPFHKLSGRCDGTAMLVTRDVVEACGGFDLSVSPKYGWGVGLDLCVRAKEHGHTVAITEASYVFHHGMQTAKHVFGGEGPYVVGAKEEADKGARGKHDDWDRKLDAISLRREITTLNLLYHVWPVLGNPRWRWNVQELLKRIEIFNGKRIVAIATGPGTESADRVKEAFTGHEVSFIEKPNSAKLREANTFLELLDAIAGRDGANTFDVGQATFYAHAKGVSRPENLAETHWAALLYRELLDNPDRVRHSLSTKGMLGVGFDFETPWIFPGTFWWFHNASLFAKPDWRTLDNAITHEGVGWSVEAFPNRFFADDHERIRAPLQYPSKAISLIYDEKFWSAQSAPLPKDWIDQHLAELIAGFDEQAYLRNNPDVARDVPGIWPNGLAHYKAFGWKEGRRPA